MCTDLYTHARMHSDCTQHSPTSPTRTHIWAACTYICTSHTHAHTHTHTHTRMAHTQTSQLVSICIHLHTIRPTHHEVIKKISRFKLLERLFPPPQLFIDTGLGIDKIVFSTCFVFLFAQQFPPNLLLAYTHFAHLSPIVLLLS